MTECFLIEPTGRIRFYAEVSCEAHGHVTLVAETYADMDGTMRPTGALGDYEDIDWPETCPECGVEISAEPDEWRNCFMGSTKEWVRPETGEIHAGPYAFGPGAMWNASWINGKADGRYMVVILPNGDTWSIDSRSSNCTRPDEDHDCWCRHGEPPNLTVDKTPEPGRSTCEAGGGSVRSGQGTARDWHGFLRGGRLESV